MPNKGKSSGKSKGKGKADKEEIPACAQSLKGIEKRKLEVKTFKPVGSRVLEEVIWEAAGDRHSELPPINGHTGIFAYHMDDCLCSMGGWPCYRDGSIWSCCGSTDKHSYCENAKAKSSTAMADGEKKVRKKKAAPKSAVERRLQGECWEGARKVIGLPPVNGHTGIFAYHMDDCMCNMAGWPCFREGSIWSCCGSTDRDSKCTGLSHKNK